MACIIAFLGVAVFSSLHHHQGASKRCSLNGFDQLATGEAEQAQMAQASIEIEWRDAVPSLLPATLCTSPSLHLRGPPATL